MTHRVSPDDCDCGPHDARRLVEFVHSFPRPAAAFVITEVGGRYVATGFHTMGLAGLLSVIHAMLTDALAQPPACKCSHCANRYARARRAHSALKFGVIEGGLH